jgi:hypothetical protein
LPETTLGSTPRKPLRFPRAVRGGAELFFHGFETRLKTLTPAGQIPPRVFVSELLAVAVRSLNLGDLCSLNGRCLDGDPQPVA